MVTASTLITHDELNSNILSSRFSVDNILGKGAFATVYAAQPRNTSLRSTNQSTLSDHHNTVALKLVNVTKIATRRRLRRRRSDGHTSVTKERQTNNEIPIDVDDNGREYDTDQLFFPSRVPLASRKEDGDEEHVSMLDMLQREISVHLSASSEKHPNIVSMMESFRYRSTGMDDLVVAMVIEYCSRGDLHSYVKRKRDERRKLISELSSKSTLIDEEEVRHALCHILRGLAFLHSYGIVHRDIKAGNILISPSRHVMNQIINGDPSNTTAVADDSEDLNENKFLLLDCTLKIGDFGLAVQMSENDDWDESQHTICGTPSCLAPEVALSTPQPVDHIKKGVKNVDDYDDSIQCMFDKESRDRDITDEEVRGHGQPADLWSAGCLLYAMLVGRYPFSSPEAVLKSSRCGGTISDKRRLICPKKSAKVQDTISRSIKGAWCLPSELVIYNPTKQILCQLLSLDPRKRGFARGLLSSHIYFKERKILPKPLPIDKVRNWQLKGKVQYTPSSIHTCHAQTIHDKTIIPPPKFSNLIDPKLLYRKIACDQTSTVKPDFYNHAHGGIENNDNLHKLVPIYRPVHSQNLFAYRTPFRNISKKYDENKSNTIKTNGVWQNGALENKIVKEKNIKDMHETKYCQNEGNHPINVCKGLEPISIHPTKLVNTICGLQRLPPSKHQWEELRQNKKSCEEILMQYYSVFILPQDMGLVISCERKDGHGAWMHVVGDGTRVSTGKLSKAPHKDFRVPPNERNDTTYLDNTLIIEAFLRCPKKAKQSLASSLNSTSYPNERSCASILNNDLCFNNTICSTRSTQSLPTFPSSAQHVKQYKALSSLLIAKNRPFLALYRRLERICNKVKQNTPKVTIYVHANTSPVSIERNMFETLMKKDNSQVGRPLCKATLMDNGPKPTVSVLFIDNVQIRYLSSTGLAKLSTAGGNIHSTGTLTFHFDEQNKGARRTAPSDTDTNNRTKAIKKYASYIKFARVAVEKCMSIDKFYRTQESHFRASSMRIGTKKKLQNCIFPIVKSMIAHGKSCNEWIDITLQSDGLSDEKEIEGDGVPRKKILKSYVGDETTFSLPSMDMLSSMGGAVL